MSVENQSLFGELFEFGDKFVEKFGSDSQKLTLGMDNDDDPVFTTIGGEHIMVMVMYLHVLR